MYGNNTFRSIKTVRSTVSMINREIVIGAAKDDVKETNTIMDVKSLIGRQLLNRRQDSPIKINREAYSAEQVSITGLHFLIRSR